MQGTVNANGQGAWSYNYVPPSTSVASGIYSFSAVAMDQSRNVSASSAALQVQVGSSVVPAGTSPKMNAVAASTAQAQVAGSPAAGTPQYASGILSGNATPGSLVTIVDGNLILGVVTASSTGAWQFTPSLSKGQHTIMVEATNNAGDTSLLSSALTVKV